ncbi:MAG: glycosyltransferase [Desulfobacterales bacterium]|nr:glycosyltransferase [Desulfobacterales bacterium]
MNLIVHAPNIHTGGGRTLLIALLATLNNSLRGYLLLDERLRCDIPIPDSFIVYRIAPSIKGRASAELLLKNLSSNENKVLCFGNLPPLLPIKGRVSVFFQNRYLVEDVSLAGFGAAERLRILVERLWLFSRRKMADQYIVQTTSIQRLLRERFSIQAIVRAFMPRPHHYQRSYQNKDRKEHAEYDFIYVASGEPHKNHAGLIKAWSHLACEGVRPKLAITVNKDKYGKLCHWIEKEVTKNNLKITNLEEIGQKELLELYRRCGALIYPSLLETIGLPLIEARVAGIAIIAAELDYVRDFVDPEYTFNPTSFISIARAVKRYMGFPEQSLHIMDATTFINHLMENT